MKLGEHIYQYRTARNMSQGDLADALNVSRQSVSKWETDSAVPELDKLVKLCELFGVSLDELVRGEEPKQAETPGQPEKDQLPPLMTDRNRYIRLTVGIMLLAMSVMTYLRHDNSMGFGLAMAAAPAVCGVILLLVKRHSILWACWGVYLSAAVFITAYKGAESPLALMFTPKAYGNRLWYDKILIGWLGLAVLVGLIAAVIITYRRDKKGNKSKAFLIDVKKIEY